MSNEVRKPKDWWIYEQYSQVSDSGIIRIATEERFSKENREQFSETHLREILPGDDSIRLEIPIGPVPNPCPRVPVAGWKDDSIRVSREDWDEIKARMEYTNSYPRKSCAEFLERIEREQGKVGE